MQNNDWFTTAVIRTGLVAVGFIGGLLFALWLGVGYPVNASTQPTWCSSLPIACIFHEWQTLIVGGVGTIVAILAAAWAWRGTQDQIRHGKTERIEDEITALEKFHGFISSIGNELEGALRNFSNGLQAIEKNQPDLDLPVHQAQRVQFALPEYIENNITFEARISFDALNSYIESYERYLRRIDDREGPALAPGSIRDNERQLLERTLNGSIRAANQLREDLEEIDSRQVQARIALLTERLDKLKRYS